ncbi:hypothetical protein [Cyanothece sp. BG0011]|uniref:hypothetical protein n=1 Tax=Cyanothece sp. BG0011 TaxID=2082950 RepID=UPI000D1DD979|nr:hypothetical protein [Cyanothece sp. BG0011]
MKSIEIRQKAKEYIEQLSSEKLLVATDFLEYLLEKEDNDATEELLKISGFEQAFTKAQENVKQGKVTSVEQLKRKY